MSSRVNSKRVAGTELGYAEITSNVVQTGAGNQVVSGLSVTVTVGSRPIRIEVGCSSLTSSSASGISTVAIKESTTTLTSASAVLTTVALPITRAVRLTPSAGSHTYKINLGQTITGNATLGAAAASPTYIHVVEV
jgi:hypothetical protein